MAKSKLIRVSKEFSLQLDRAYTKEIELNPRLSKVEFTRRCKLMH